VQTLKTALLVVFMLIAVYGAYMIISKPPAKPPAEVTQLTAEDLQAPNIGIGKTVSPDELVFGSAADVSNEADNETDSGNEFNPDELESSLDINIDGFDEDSLTTPKNENPSELDASTDPGTSVTTPDGSDQQQPGPGTVPFGGQEGAAFVDPSTQDKGTTGQPSAAGNPLDQTGSQTPLIVSPEQNPAALIEDPMPVNPASVTQSFASPAERSFEKAWNSAIKQSQQQHFREALLTLSVFFDDPNLSQVNQTKLLRQLDALAAHVIYSRQHLLEPAFVVRPGDTIQSIAKQYRVPAALLQNINGINSNSSLLPGTEIKVARGPFRASVSLAKNEMTVFLGHLYAGRFPVSLGNNPGPRPGSYQVQLKQPGRPFYDEAQQLIPVGDVKNPYGNVWIDLGSNLSIHGSPRTAADASQSHRCIGLNATDAQDIYGILTEGSQVIIRR